MARMVKRVARATMEQMQRDGPTVAYVLSFADTNRIVVILTFRSRTVARGFQGESK